VYDTLVIVDTVLTVEHHYHTETIVDTVYQTDPVYDTVVVIDTIVTVVNHYDTTTIVDTIYQTDPVYDTTIIHDTVIVIQQIHDTTYTVDTVGGGQAQPIALLAYTALQYYSDALVIDAINAELGIDDGWIFYLSVYINEVTYPSEGVFDIYGGIDYWTPDWSGFYPFEYYWRMTYVSGDPADPRNWQMSDPPAGIAPGKTPGVNRATARSPIIETGK
ncbi:MAG: hypothetical protein OEV80_18740, partial [candidate division Zixibacteria bacterium]|nr:hypothetical protein [candidate division Zixibacteria bacterium]